MVWGQPGDIPVFGDYDGDFRTDIAVWRPDSGIWYILPSSEPGSYTSIAWGQLADIPAPGDYDGDNKTDVTVWRPANGNWYALSSRLPGHYSVTQWGLPTDIPISSLTRTLNLISRRK